MTSLSSTAAVRHSDHVVVLSTGDVRIPRYPHVAAQPSVGDQHYRGPAGEPELRKLVAAHSSPRLSADQIVITPGARQAIVVALRAVLGHRPEVLLTTPYWGSYPPLVEMAGGRAVMVPGSVGANEPDLNALAAACTAGTGALIVNSPRNPDGAVTSRACLQQLVEWTADRNLVLLFDQVYRGVALTPEPAPSVLELPPGLPGHCIVVDGLSKSYALAGLRLGWAIAPPAVAPRMSAIASHLIGGTSSAAQDVATTVLSVGAGHEPDHALAENLRLALGVLDAIPDVTCVPPAGGIFLFPDLTGWLRRAPQPARDNLTRWLLDEHGVAVVDGAAFGAPQHVRLSFAIPHDRLAEGMRRLQAALTAPTGAS